MEEGKQALKDGADPFSGRSQPKGGLPVENGRLEKTPRKKAKPEMGKPDIYCF